MLATMMETELEEAPTTPTTLSGLVMIGEPPPRHFTSVLSFSIRACTKVSDCSKAWVSLEQVSRMRAPSVMFGNRLLSLLMRSRAKSIASSLWMPFSFLSSPHGFPSWPLACTGKSPPKDISPSRRMEFRCVCPGSLGLAASEDLRALLRNKSSNSGTVGLLRLQPVWSGLHTGVWNMTTKNNKPSNHKRTEGRNCFMMDGGLFPMPFEATSTKQTLFYVSHLLEGFN